MKKLPFKKTLILLIAAFFSLNTILPVYGQETSEPPVTENEPAAEEEESNPESDSEPSEPVSEVQAHDYNVADKLFSPQVSLTINDQPAVDGMVIKNGDPFKLGIAYSLPTHHDPAFTSADTFTYQVPAQFIIPSKDNGVIYQPGTTIEVGSYTIKDNQIQMQFTDAYLQQGNREVSLSLGGSIHLEPTLKPGAPVEITLPGGDSFEFEYTDGKGLEIQKTAKKYTDPVAGQMLADYTIIVNSLIDDTNVVIKDEFVGELSILDDSVQIQLKGGAADASTLSKDPYSWQIASMPKGSQAIITYTAQLPTALPDQGQAAGHQVNNTATASGTISDQVSDTETVEYHPLLLGKTGSYDASSRQITWTITVKPGEVKSFTLKDILASSLMAEPGADSAVLVTLNGKGNGSISYGELKAGYTITRREINLDDVYTFTFTVDLKDGQDKDTTVKNQAVITQNNTVVNGSVWVPAQTPDIDANKRLVSYDEKNHSLTWQLDFTISQDITSPITLFDLVPSNLNNNKNFDHEIIEDSWTLYYNNVPIEIEDLDGSWKFTSKKLEAVFENGMGAGRYSIRLRTTFDPYKASMTYPDAYSAYISNAAGYGINGKEYYWSSRATVRINNILKTVMNVAGDQISWGITAANEIFAKDAKLVDVLPEGLEFVSAELNGKEIEPEIDGQKLTFAVGPMKKGDILIINTKVTDYKKLQEKVNFKNTVNLVIGDNKYPDRTSSAEVSPYQAVTKKGYYDQSTAPYVHYFITINPEEKQLIQNGSDKATINVTDTLADSLKIEESSIRVNNEVPADYSINGNTLIIRGLKDKTHYVISYDASFQLDPGTQLTPENSRNTVKLSGIDYAADESEMEFSGKVFESTISATGTTFEAGVFKADGYGLPMKDVHFKIYSYGKGSEPDPAQEKLVKDVLTNETGQTPRTILDFDTIYRMVENPLPEHVKEPAQTPYFVRPSKNNTLDYGPEIQVLKGYNAYSFNLLNEKEYLSIPVTKTWNDNNNQDGIRPALVKVQLYADNKPTSQILSLTAENNWQGQFANLDYYQDGVPIKYTIRELGVTGYEPVITGSMNEGFEITNTHVPQTVNLPVQKLWLDNNNQDGLRPESLEVTLLKNGEAFKTVILNPENNWESQFKDLPVYEKGQKIVYKLTEPKVEGYESAIAGPVITNTHKPETTSLRIVKKWQDNNNQDGLRPETIGVNIYKNGELYASEALTQANQYTLELKDLPVYEKGQKIEYTVKEDEATLGAYESSLKQDGNTFTFTNRYTPEVTAVSGTKIWQDGNNQDHKRPEEYTVYLLANNEKVASKTLKSDETTFTFNNLPKYQDGRLIDYTLAEEPVKDYASTISGHTITNSYTPEKTELHVYKIWRDHNNQDGIRPQEVKINLLKNGKATSQSLSLNVNNHFQGTFENLPKYENGQEIQWSVAEVKVDGYSTQISGTGNIEILNQHRPALTQISGTKIWDDEDNQDGRRPAQYTVELHSDKGLVAVKTLPSDQTSFTFDNLPMYENGQKINYFLAETPTDNYQSQISGSVITNRYTPRRTQVRAFKVWSDKDNQDGKRPASVRVWLVKNGTVTKEYRDLSADSFWQASFDDLPMYERGKLIQWTVQEEPADGYTLLQSGSLLVNTYTPQTTSLKGKKIWADQNNQDGKRPDQYTVNLYADGIWVQSQTMSADTLEFTFDNLPLYKDQGQRIHYTISEEAIPGYQHEVKGTTLINAYTPDLKQLDVIKIWNDDSNRDGLRPDYIEVYLYANGEKTDESRILSAENHYQASFENLPVYANGKEIQYTIEEEKIPGYESSLAQGDTTTIINTHEPETTAVSGRKTWKDNNNQDGLRPESLEIQLWADNQLQQTVVTDAAANWSYNFENLPKYEAGQEIQYTVKEQAVPGYQSAAEGYDLINRYDPAKTQLHVIKQWDDENDQDGLRPEEIEVQLYADGQPTDLTLKLNAENSWQGSFDNLDLNKDGKPIVYTVKEAAIEGYESSLIQQDSTIILTNSHVPARIDIQGQKTWLDQDQDPNPPAEIRIDLYGDSQFIESTTVTAEQNWQYSFKDLPACQNGQKINYQIQEQTPVGYTSKIDGYNITNTFTPKKLQLNLVKIWDDGNNADGLRPEEVQVKILANGKDTGKTLTLSTANNFQGVVKDLPMYENGKEIVYSLQETAVKGYTSKIQQTSPTSFQIINYHQPKKDKPQTAVFSYPYLWIGLLAVSGLAIIAVLIAKFRKA